MNTIGHQSSWEYLLYICTYDIYIYKRFSLIEWKSRANLKVANKADIFLGKPFITYSRSLFIFYVPKLSMNRESEDPLWGLLLPPSLPLSLSPISTVLALSASIGPDRAPEPDPAPSIASIGKQEVQTHTHKAPSLSLSLSLRLFLSQAS